MRSNAFENEFYPSLLSSQVLSEFEDVVYLVRRGKFEAAVKLIEEQNINLKAPVRPNGATLVHVAAEFGHMKILEYLMIHGGSKMRMTDSGEWPIHIAAREGRTEVVKYFVEELGVDVNVEMKDGWTPLTYASMNGWCSLIEYLNSKGVNLDHRDKSLRTAVHWAVRCRQARILKLLIQCNADMDILDCEEKTPLDIAQETEA